jgi:hypothetical protein
MIAFYARIALATLGAASAMTIGYVLGPLWRWHRDQEEKARQREGHN